MLLREVILEVGSEEYWQWIMNVVKVCWSNPVRLAVLYADTQVAVHCKYSLLPQIGHIIPTKKK